MDELIQILNELHPEIDFQKNQKLIDDGVLDSFDIIALVSDLNEKYGIEIGVEHLIPENFNSVTAILNLVTTLQSE